MIISIVLKNNKNNFEEMNRIILNPLSAKQFNCEMQVARLHRIPVRLLSTSAQTLVLTDTCVKVIVFSEL